MILCLKFLINVCIYISIIGREEVIHNEQSKVNGSIGHTRHRTKTNTTQKHNTTQKTKKMSHTDSTRNWWMNADARKGLAIPVSHRKIAFSKFTIVVEAAHDNRKRLKLFTRIINLYLIKKTTGLNASIERLKSFDCGRPFQFNTLRPILVFVEF
jgi:hypothetical protein